MRFRLVPKSSTLDDLGCWSAWKPFLLPWCTLLHHVICHPLLSYNTWLHPVSTDWLDLCHMLRGRGLQKSLHEVRFFLSSEQIWISFWMWSLIWIWANLRRYHSSDWSDVWLWMCRLVSEWLVVFCC